MKHLLIWSGTCFLLVDEKRNHHCFEFCFSFLLTHWNVHFFRLWGGALFVCLFTKLLNRTECPVFFFLTSLFKREPGLFCLLGYFQRKKNCFHKKINKGEKMSTHIFKLDSWRLLMSKLQVSYIISFRTVSLRCEIRRTRSLPELTTPTPSQDDYGSMCWSAAACRHTVLPFPPLTQKAF